MTKPKPNLLRWDDISEHNTTHRAAVPGGWLVRYDHMLAFVPDPEHTWEERILLQEEEGE